MKKRGSFQKKRFLFFLNRQWGEFDPQNPFRAYATGGAPETDMTGPIGRVQLFRHNPKRPLYY